MRVLALLTIAASGAAWGMWATGSTAFERYLGGGNPGLMIVGLGLVGLPCLRVLRRRGWILSSAADGSVVRRIALSAVPFVIPVVIVDVLGGFPEGINVGAPASIAFYPAIALVAELAFHVIPLALVAGLYRGGAPLSRRYRRSTTTAVAAIEPILQMVWGSEGSPLWANAYVGIHVFAFNLLGLWWFRRHGFVAVYVFRAGYYLLWHIAWGSARLEVLF